MLGAGVAAAVTIACLPAAPPGAALPAWSPAADRIAYTVPAQETGAIEVAKPGKVSASQGWLSYDSAPTRLAWSPVGDRIAFEKRTGAIEILSLGRNSASTEVVHADHGASTELGDWSPDGRAFVFVRDFQVFVFDTETGDTRSLAGDAHATWSPDGLELAIASGRNIYGIQPDGTGFRTIANVDTEVSSIAWSPDSTRLAFVGKVIGLVSRFGGQAAYTVPAEPPLAWRPNGIFYNLTRVAPVQTSVWRFDPDTGARTQLTHLPVKFDARFATYRPTVSASRTS
jgi:dipeptidyl aminopeptidase/acylaminoacyl peptidase